jgi:hypothetical protein
VGYKLLYKDDDIKTHMRVKRLQWAGRVVRIFDIRIPKRNLEASEGEVPPETDKNWSEDEVRKNSGRWLNMRKWRAAARH